MASATTQEIADQGADLARENLAAQEAARIRRRYGPFFWLPLA